MAIIVEGIDNSGKSTLARLIAKRLGLLLVESEGPPKYPGEMNARVERYFSMPGPLLFVRHPCVSQVIYGKLRGEEDSISADLVREFYNQQHLFIYCDPLGRGLEGHVVKDEHDSPAHLKAIEDKYSNLLAMYRDWAINRAHMFYRIGDSMDRVVKACSTVA
ncbi:MAG: hypothetical protein CGW95_01025 [Phenylobacterium zucineum]|nr:MAG: hypothetical protein CGW95_01025 [Phenylobacterium zucineum]